MTSRDGGRPPRFRSKGGLLFVGAALPLLLLLPSASLAWTSPLGGGMAHQHLAAMTSGARTRTIGSQPSPRHQASLSMSSNTASSPEQRPLAKEGDWIAYFDENYGRVYYFNHATGDTTWHPPTPTFPVPPEGPPEMMMEGMMDEMNDPRMMRGGPTTSFGGPAPQAGPNDPRSQNEPPPQQRRQATFYETLRVPPNATASQIKQSYLELAKLYDSRMEGGRRSREFNEIARAWMVLSDGRLRERYDRQLEQWELERRMREKMMEEERQWMEEQRTQSMTGPDNKFAKDPIYRKKMEVLDDDGTNKFGGRRVGGGVQQRGGGGFVGGPRPLEIDEEAEAMRYRREEAALTEEEEAYMAEQMAMAADRKARMQREQRQARDQALEEKQRIVDERKREERRRASSERDVIQDKPIQPPGMGWQQPPQQGQPQQPEPKQQQPQQQAQPQQPPPKPKQPLQPGQQDLNEMMKQMKEKFSQKKMDEAARVQDELSRLSFGGRPKQGGAPAAAPRGRGAQSAAPRGVLFPGKGGIVAEDSKFVAKDILLDEYLGRPPSFISWVPPEEGSEAERDAADNVRAAMSFGDASPKTATGQRQTGQERAGGAAPAATMSGEREREQERLQNIKSRGVGGMGNQQQQQQQLPEGGFGDQLKYGPASGGFGPTSGGFGPASGGVVIQASTNPPKTSSKAREEARLQGMKAMGQPATGQRGPVERTTLGTDQATAPKTSATEREQRRLQNMKAMGQHRDSDFDRRSVGSGRSEGKRTKASQQPRQPTASAASTFGGGANAGPGAKPPQTKAAAGVDGKIRELQEAHCAEMAKLKSDMEEAASKTLEEQIVNIAKIHAAEITKLKSNFNASASRGAGQNAMQVEQLKANQAEQREQMREEITREVEREAAAKISEMQAAHQAEMERVLAESKRSDDEAVSVLRSELEELKNAHFEELDDMAARHDEEMARLRGELETRSKKMAEAHRLQIQKLTQDQKGASAADALKFQEAAMEKLGAQHKKEMAGMVAKHEREIEQLRADLEDKSLREVEVRVADATRSMSAQHKAEMEEMAKQHKSDMDALVQTELQKLKKQHAREMEEALADKQRLAQQQESVTRELKKAESQGVPAMTKNQKIEMVLQSFEGVYDPVLIRQLRSDLKAREEELKKQIVQSKEQISTLEHELDSSKGTEERLNHEIQTLTKWKEGAEAELQRAKLNSNKYNEEVSTLIESIRTMTAQMAELKSQLDSLTRERDMGKKEIYELREWKKNAEVERGRLEKELKSKDGDIAKLKYDYRERDEDVNILVPEVARLQELTVTLEGLNEKRSRDYELLTVEVELLKSNYEREIQSTSDTVQSLEGRLSAEQSKNAASIAKLQRDIEAKEKEMSTLESTAFERSQTIADMKRRLEDYSRESERTVEEHKRKIATMSAGFERELAQGKAAHEAQLKQLEAKLRNDIQRLQRDLNSRSDKIADLKVKLDASSASNTKLSGEIVGLDSQRRSTELLKKSSHDLDVGRLQNQIQVAQQSGAANTAQIQALQSELTKKTAEINRLADQFALEKGCLLADLNALMQWKDSAQVSINALSNEVAVNALPGGGNKIDSVIAKLAGIRNELRRRDDQISQAKSATEALLKKGQDHARQQQRSGGTRAAGGGMIETRSAPPPSAGTVIGGAFLDRNIVPNVNVIGGGFSRRQKNIATVRKNTLTSSSSPHGSGGVVAEKDTAPSPQPTLVTAEPQPPNMMSAYDAALAGAQTEQGVAADSGRGVDATLRSNLPATANARPRSSGTMSAYDAALAAMQREEAKTPAQAAQTNPATARYAADEYRTAEKQFRVEADALTQAAASSYQKARELKGGWNRKKYDEAFARANEEKARADELLAKADEMKEKAERQGLMGP